MKIRIFALAKELGMDSKLLIKHCNDAGIHVKTSALASISPQERDILMAHLASAGSGQTAVADEPLAPTREMLAETKGKVRSLKVMTPRSQPPRARRGESEQSQEESGTATADTATTDTAIESESPEETEAAETPTREAAPVAQDASDVPAAEQTKPAGEDEPPKPDQEAGRRVVPISRDDYVPASGSGSQVTGVREMRPRGAGGDADRQARRPKGRTKPSLPNLAAPPSIKLPKSRKGKDAEGPAQKPDLKLSAELLEQQSPLASHLKKHAEDKRKRDRDEEEAGDRTRGPRPATGGLGLEESRQQRREQRKQKRRDVEEEAPVERGGTGPRRRRQKRSGPVEFKSSAEVESPVTVRSLSEAMGRPAKELLKVMFRQGRMVNINEILDDDDATELAIELGVDLTIKRPRDLEDELAEMVEAEEPAGKLVGRPPIVTILGHVDHGKTSLLDRIRSAHVAAGEAGGITQHIASYQVEHNGQKITFVDTPGHAAFGEMRARGANITDIVVLVVAADDGVMPQTVECISHAKAAEVPVVVAMNKIDLPDVNQEKVLADLSTHGLVPHEWGGDIEVIRTSAQSGEGIEDLLETILLTAELNELTTNPDRPAIGVCLEAFRDEGRGVISWLVVQKGTLRVGDTLVCGPAYGRIRAMYNDRDQQVEEAGPSTPIKVSGLDMVPNAGDHFFVLSDIDEAREVAEQRRHRGRTAGLAGRNLPRTLDDILHAAKGGAVQDLPLIIKADSPGSIEALRSEIQKFEHPEVRARILHDGVGGVNESDVYLAAASQAIIVAFHVIAEDRAMALAEREGVEIRRYNVIYEVTDQIKRVLEGLLIPERREVATGRAIVLQTFQISRVGTIAGCRVLNGTIERSNRVHVIRDQTVLNDYEIASLRREKDDVKEVRDGMECGIRLSGFNDVKEGDLLEAFRIDEIKRTLD